LVQTQAQLAVTLAPRNITFGLLQGSRPVQVPVEAYPEYHAIIVEQSEWMLDLIRRGEPPTPTHRSAESLRRLFPNSDGSTVRLPIDAVEWTREVQEIAEQIKTMESRSEELRNMLRLAIGPATYGELAEPVGGKGAWKYGVIANGTRPLIQLKAAPGSAPAKRNLLDAPVSLKALPEADLITQYRNSKRRKARR
jgi:predicted phage-related endonuclease